MLNHQFKAIKAEFVWKTTADGFQVGFCGDGLPCNANGVQVIRSNLGKKQARIMAESHIKSLDLSKYDFKELVDLLKFTIKNYSRGL